MMDKPDAVPDDYIGIDEFARRANLEVPQVVQAVRDGIIVGQKIAGEWYIKIDNPALHPPPEFSYDLWIRQILKFQAGWAGFAVTLVALAFVVLTAFILVPGHFVHSIGITVNVFTIPVVFGGVVGYFLAALLFYPVGKRRYEKMTSR